MPRPTLTLAEREESLSRIRRLQRETVYLLASWLKPSAPERVRQVALRQALELLAEQEGLSYTRIKQLVSTPVRTL